MRSTLLIFSVSIVLTACGSRQSTSDNTLVDSQKTNSTLNAVRRAIQNGNPERADPLLVTLESSSHMADREWARLFRSQLQKREDIGRAADSMLQVYRRAVDDAVRAEAGLLAGLYAVEARRCLTAQKLLPAYTLAPHPAGRRSTAALSLSHCKAGLEALQLLVIAMETPASQQRARSLADARLKTIDHSGLRTALHRLKDSPLGPLIAAEILRRPGSGISTELRSQAQTLLPAPEVPIGPSPSTVQQGPVTFILPLADGVGGRFGRLLKKDLDVRERRLSEDRIGNSRITLVDGSNANAIDAAFEGASKNGEGAVVGLFNRMLLPHAVDAAQRHQVAALLLTASGRGRRSDAPTWRILPTSSHSTLAVAGALRDRGARKVLVLRGPDKRSTKRSKQLETVWNRHCEQVQNGCSVTILDGSSGDSERLASQAAAQEFDALYLPVPAVHAAQLMKYLATHGIWAGTGHTGRRANDGSRRVTVIGESHWYTPTALGLLGTYGHGALLPVPFAVETARGERIAHLLQEGLDPDRRTVLVIALDAIEAVRAARTASASTGASLFDVLRKQGFTRGATVGFDFTRKHALRNLMILEITPQGFRPSESD